MITRDLRQDIRYTDLNFCGKRNEVCKIDGK